jgi:hypothetical protein
MFEAWLADGVARKDGNAERKSSNYVFPQSA